MCGKVTPITPIIWQNLHEDWIKNSRSPPVDSIPVVLTHPVGSPPNGVFLKVIELLLEERAIDAMSVANDTAANVTRL